MLKKKSIANAKLEISIKVALRDKGGRLLILGCVPWGSMPGYFDLPGGRITNNELRAPIAKIIKRELKEELGQSVRFKIFEKPTAFGTHDYQIKKKRHHVLWLVFSALYMSGKIKLSPEHISYRWEKITKANLNKFFTKGALRTMKNYFGN